MHEISIQRRVPPAGIPSAAQLRAWAEHALEGASCGEVTIRIVDEAESAQLNGRFRHKPYPTNVLSFPYEAEGVGAPVLGDIVICAAVVAREAAEQAKNLREHWAHMVIHGTLHLLGFDHVDAQDAEVMEGRERELMARLGFADPY
jgi:probable rRNA maturation factor